MSLISEQQIQQFHEEGYFVTTPMWAKDELQAVSDEFDRLCDEYIRSVDASDDTDDRARELAKNRPFIGAVHTCSELLCEFAKSPIYLEACLKLIGPDVDLYFNQAVIKLPVHGQEFGWHQDSGYLATTPLEYITCWTAISRSFVDNGCIWVIPGSPKGGLRTHRFNEQGQSKNAVLDNEDGAIPVEMEPGQVAVFSSLMLHKSGPNISRETRKGYVPQYHVPGVVITESKKKFGDVYPVLRDGQRVDVPVPEPIRR